jgi:hypothetical protein
VFPKSIDRINCSSAAQQSCANLDSRVDLFVHHETDFVLRIDTSARKLHDTEADDLTRFQRQQYDGKPWFKHSLSGFLQIGTNDPAPLIRRGA